MKNRKIAIIGTSIGQRELYRKARLLGYYTIGFSWGTTDEMLSLMDKFYQISIIEKDIIVQKCREERVCGVVSNGSDLTSLIASYVAEKLNLTGTPYNTIINIQNKFWVREQTKDLEGLSNINYYIYNGCQTLSYPFVVKPVNGEGKSGVSYVTNEDSFNAAVDYASKHNETILIEEYIEGLEISVESISFQGRHKVVQITDKESTGAPHFIEVGHHQPSQLPPSIQEKIRQIVPNILYRVGFKNGATHIELKVNDDKIYLIEINSRGGGGEISNTLVELSTGYDYIAAMIKVATGTFKPQKIVNRHCAGIYFICAQLKERFNFFCQLKNQNWLITKQFDSKLPLTESTGNHDRNGYFIYQSSNRIKIDI